MYFIAILIVFGLLQYWGTFSLFHKDAWFFDLQQTTQRIVGKYWLAYVFIVIFPCVLLGMLLCAFEGRAYGLVSLLLAVFILVYCLGRVPYNNIIIDYVSAWKDGNYESLPALLQRLENNAEINLGEGLQRTHVNARESYIYAAFQGVFVVLFWFVIFGPVGALLYRLNTFFITQNNWPVAEKIQHILEWPAARLAALAFAFIGDFEECMPIWADAVFNKSMTNRHVLYANALAAVDLDMQWLEGDFSEKNTLQQQNKLVQLEMKDLMHLVKRCLVFSIFVIAIFQIVI
jgi:AmpE protein